MANSTFRIALLIVFVSSALSIIVTPTNVTCQSMLVNRLGVATLCQTSQPWPIKVSLSMKLTENTEWKGANDWFYSMSDINYRDYNFAANSCTYSQSPAGNYTVNSTITVSVTCTQAPKALAYGDKINFVTFYSRSNWYWSGVRVDIFASNNTVLN